MDTIDSTVIENVAWAVNLLDVTQLGAVHTVVVALDGATGGCLVTVSSELAADITLVVR